MSGAGEAGSGAAGVAAGGGGRAAAIDAEAFRQARRARRRELVEDYVELIAELGRDGAAVRQAAITERLGVAQPTVAKMLKRLAAAGLIERGPSRGVLLSAEGRRIAEAGRARHELVEGFLRAIGVDAATARIDAEGIEHHVSEETLAALRRFSERLAAGGG